MSVLRGKNVLVIGEETDQVKRIEKSLEQDGAIIHNTICEKITPDILEADHVDVVFLNHLHENRHCEKLLNELRKRRDTKVLPVFALVAQNESNMEHVLSLGAADYFTTTESVRSILEKVRIVLGDPVNVAGNEVIDIGVSDFDSKKKGVRVLIVEDDPLLANLLGSQLERVDFPFHINRTGDNVKEDIDSFVPDILILDLMLPGKSGFDILADIRKDKSTKTLPVLIFSNRDSDADKQRAAELQVSGFFVKAMTNLSDLVRSIEKNVKHVDQ